MQVPSSTDYEFQTLSALQDQILSIVPIPAALLSIFGSVSIILMNCRNRRKSRNHNYWTPYNRLLIAMSSCDIIYSATLAISVFLLPQETSRRLYAGGNDASCSAIGFLIQFSNSTILYNIMMSFYFLFLARFGMKNDTIARFIEPVMHILSLGYPLVTGIVGLVMGVYSEPELSLNYCWVNNYPRQCGDLILDGPGVSGEKCQSPTIAWFFAGIWIIIAFFALVINNLIIFFFVHRQTKNRRSVVNKKLSVEAEPDSESVPSRDTNSKDLQQYRVSMLEEGGGGVRTNEEDNQLSRLQLVRSQALLFVAGYVISMFFSSTLRIKEAYADSYEKKLPANNYTLLVLQAWTLPLQGFFNMLVYVRPKYLKRREVHSKESRIEAFRRCIFGEKKKENSNNNNNEQPQAEAPKVPVAGGTRKQEPSNANTPNTKYESTVSKGSYFKRLGKSMLSSLTASHGDFVIDESETERWGKTCESDCPMGTPVRSSSSKGISRATMAAFNAIDDVCRDTTLHSSMSFSGELKCPSPDARMRPAVLSSKSEDAPPSLPKQSYDDDGPVLEATPMQGLSSSSEFSSSADREAEVMPTDTDKRWRISEAPMDDTILGTPKRHSSGMTVIRASTTSEADVSAGMMKSCGNSSNFSSQELLKSPMTTSLISKRFCSARSLNSPLQTPKKCKPVKTVNAFSDSPRRRSSSLDAPLSLPVRFDSEADDL